MKRRELMVYLKETECFHSVDWLSGKLGMSTEETARIVARFTDHGWLRHQDDEVGLTEAGARAADYFSHRLKSSVPARCAWDWAKSAADDSICRPELDWEGGSGFDGEICAGPVVCDGFTIYVKLKPDYDYPDTSYLGEFLDRYADGAIPISAEHYLDEPGDVFYYRSCNHRSYNPDIRFDKAYAGFAYGMCRGDWGRAHNEGLKADIRELARYHNGHWSMYTIEVTAYRHGVELGDALVGGYQVDEFFSKSEDYIRDSVYDLIGEAVAMARDNLGKLGSADVVDRLEYLRAELRAERISYGELAELQSLAEFIEPGDVELLEAAGVPEDH